jgi:hypothetical protein
MAFDGPLLGGRWRLGPRMGGGSQGELFLARDEKPRRGEDAEVIVKRLALHGTWKSFELFEREAKVLAQLRHPGVPRHIATLEEPPGTFNLVMTRVPGQNLRELVARRRLGELELRDILIRCLEIVDYLHARMPPVVHRDIKPSNIVRAPDGKVALVDFGGVLDAARDKGGSTIVGTFGYMAPEQLHGRVTPATDIYALGATIVALAGGIEPEDVPRKGLRMDLDKHLPALDRGLRAALIAMTDPDPDKRPQRAREGAAADPRGARRRDRARAPGFDRDGAAPAVRRHPGAGRDAAAARRARLRRQRLDRHGRAAAVGDADRHGHRDPRVPGAGQGDPRRPRARQHARRGAGRLHRHDARRDGAAHRPPLTRERARGGRAGVRLRSARIARSRTTWS